MKALIVAGLASLVGVAGVVGLTRMSVEGGLGDQSAPALVSASGERSSATLAARLARLRTAERAADAAMARVDARTRQARAMGAPSVTYVRATAPVAAPWLDDDHPREYGEHDGGSHEDD